MKIKTKTSREYSQTLENYFNTLKLAQEDEALPKNFDQEMDRFVEELKALVSANHNGHNNFRYAA